MLPDRVLGVSAVRRGVALAAVTGGALAAAGTATVSLPDGDPGAPVLALAAERAPVPPVSAGAPSPGPAGALRLTVPVPSAGTPLEPAVLDTAGLSRAVARAQGQARKLAEEARDRPDRGRVAPAPRPVDRADDDEQAEEDRRTAERARRAGRAADPEPAPASAGRECGLDTGGLGAIKAHVRAAAETLGCAFGKPEVLGIAGRGGPSDHPRGLALDFMVDRATGDALAAHAVRNRDALGINYVIWRQRIDTGSGFRAMADRGGATANHFDHVHISFRPSVR